MKFCWCTLGGTRACDGCPNKNDHSTTDYNRYCPYCGQKLKEHSALCECQKEYTIDGGTTEIKINYI